jgi:hypothetical protein
MNEFCLDSVDFDKCKKTPKNILKFLVKCDYCSKLPIPQYKCFKNQNKTFCKTCFINNENREDMIKPSKLEMNILEQVVISCSNQKCERVFNIYSLNEMIKHEENCLKIKVN